MKSLLIGSTGFLGRSLSDQFAFTHSVSGKSPNVGGRFELVVCAAPSAKKWFAFQNPEADLHQVKSVIDRLQLIVAEKFILLSTVDVYKEPKFANESSELCGSENPYGFHRQYLEEYVRSNFNNHLILRLGGLVGKYLVKNPVFDLKHGNNLSALAGNSRMQFLPVDALGTFLRQAVENNYTGTVNLTAEPIQLASAARLLDVTLNSLESSQNYDVSSNFLEALVGKRYLSTSHQSLAAIGAYFESE